MNFSPFSRSDFEEMKAASYEQRPPALKSKTEALRKALGAYPEFKLDFFKHRLARRPRMRGRQGLVFGPARWSDQHWYLFDVGGDQNQVQLNIGMFPDHIRVGLGFMIGRQVAPKPPAFHVFQTFLGIRPPLPFRNALLEATRDHELRLEIQGNLDEPLDPDQVLARLETYHVPPNETTVFVFLGHIWGAEEAESKAASKFREAFGCIMPFYEELILASASYYFHMD